VSCNNGAGDLENKKETKKVTHIGVASPSLGDCTVHKEDLALMNCLRLMKLVVVNTFLCSPATTPKNSLDDTKQGANSLELQVQSVVARVKFPREETRGLYRTLTEQSKISLRSSSSNLQNNFLVLCPQLHRVVVKHKM
jgi:hypothetical protein